MDVESGRSRPPKIHIHHAETVTEAE